MPEEEKKFETAKELKDFMCDNGYGKIAIDGGLVGLSDDDIDKAILLNRSNKSKSLVKIEKANGIGEAVIYLDPHLTDNQKVIIREKFDQNLSDITRLDLRNLGLKALPKSIGKLTALEKLYLNNNRLT